MTEQPKPLNPCDCEPCECVTHTCIGERADQHCDACKGTGRVRAEAQAEPVALLERCLMYFTNTNADDPCDVARDIAKHLGVEWVWDDAAAPAYRCPPRPAEGEASSIPCCKCGGEVVEFSAPNDLWNAVVRKGGKEHDQEYLCLRCFLRMIPVPHQGEAAAWIVLRDGKSYHTTGSKATMEWFRGKGYDIRPLYPPGDADGGKPSTKCECVWREDPDGQYETGCGQVFILNHGTPADNDMRHCCYCGKPLVDLTAGGEEGGGDG